MMDSLQLRPRFIRKSIKKISDLIYNNEFTQISFIDAQRRLLIKKIKESEIKKSHIKKRISKLVENNLENIKIHRKKITKSLKKS